MQQGVFEFSKDGAPLTPVPTKETDKIDPGSIYAASKYAQEQMCQIACATVGISFIALRLQNVYGPGQRSEEHPYELQSLIRISYAVFSLKNKKIINHTI